MTQPAHGEWYLATDGKWYCWPDPTPHDQPPAPPAPPMPPAPPAGYQPSPATPAMPAMPPAPGAPAAPGTGAPGYGAPTPDYPAPSYATSTYDAAPAAPAAQPNRNAAWLTIAGGALCVIGSMLPWAKIQSLFITLSPTGMDGSDGVITMILGLVAAAVGVGAIARWSLPRWTEWVPIVACVIAGLVAIANFVDVKGLADEMPGGEGLGTVSVGVGLYVIIVGAIIGAVGGWLLRARD